MTTPPEEPQVPESGSTPPPPPPAAPTPPAAPAAGITADSIKEYLKPAEGLDPMSAKLGYAMAGLGLLTFIAAFLPWVSVEAGGFSESSNGVSDSSDGVFTLLLGLAAGGLGAARALRGMLIKPSAIAAAAAGAIITLIAIIDIADISDKGGDLEDLGSGVPGFSFDVSSGFGLWLTLIMGIGFIGVGAFALVKNK